MNPLYGLQQGRAYEKIQTRQLNRISRSQVNNKLLQETTSPSLGNVREGLENMNNKETEELITLFNTYKNEFNSMVAEYKNTLNQYFEIEKNGTSMTVCPSSYTPYGDGSACKDKEDRKCALYGNDELPRCSNIQVCPMMYNVYGDGSACKNSIDQKCALWGNEELPRCPIETYVISEKRRLKQNLENLNGQMTQYAHVLFNVSNQLQETTLDNDVEYTTVRNELLTQLSQLEKQRIEFKNTDFNIDTLSKQLSDIKLESESNTMKYGIISLGVILVSFGIYHGLNN